MLAPTPRGLVIGGGIVVALVLVAGGAWLWMSSQQQRGSSVYAASLMRAYQSQVPDAAADAQTTAAVDLERALAEYPSNTMAAQAAYELGNLRFQARQFDKARAAWQITLARGASGTLATLAHAGIGYAWEAERTYPEAVKAYEAAVAELKPTDFYYEELLMNIARIHEISGKKDAAVETYKRILKERPNSLRADDIRSRLASAGVAP